MRYVLAALGVLLVVGSVATDRLAWAQGGVDGSRQSMGNLQSADNTRRSMGNLRPGASTPRGTGQAPSRATSAGTPTVVVPYPYYGGYGYPRYYGGYPSYYQRGGYGYYPYYPRPYPYYRRGYYYLPPVFLPPGNYGQAGMIRFLRGW